MAASKIRRQLRSSPELNINATQLSRCSFELLKYSVHVFNPVHYDSIDMTKKDEL